MKNKSFKIYELNSDGEQEKEYTYKAITAYEAMKKHLYYITLTAKNIMINLTEKDIYKTAFGYGLNVLNNTYWIKGD